MLDAGVEGDVERLGWGGLDLRVLTDADLREEGLVVRVSLVIAIGYLVFALHNLGFSSMGLPIQTAWGVGSNVVLGIPIGLLLVPVASYALDAAYDTPSILGAWWSRSE